MGTFQDEMEELVEIIQKLEPEAEVTLQKRFFRREWTVKVKRPRGLPGEYMDVHHYWLERALVNTFCRSLGEK